MRAGQSTNIYNPVEMQQVDPEAAAETQVLQDTNKPDDNKAKKTAIWFWLGILVIYLIWDFFVLKNKKLSDAVEPANIRANFYNILFVTLAAVIGINLMKVLLVKVSIWKVPGLSNLANKLMPLVQLS